MILRGIQFGSVWCSSGSLGFYGDGYWYHKLLKLIGLNYEGVTFVSKTTTLSKRAGNMMMNLDGISPKQFLPPCIKVNFLKGAVLNSVGLTGPGAMKLLDSGRWQSRKSPFAISFMSVAESVEDRIKELGAFIRLLKPQIKHFKSKFALEINFSCPNVGVKSMSLAEEVSWSLDVASTLGIPLIPNFGPDIDPKVISEVADHRHCDAVSIANTLKWGNLPNEIDWKSIWGSDVSPLVHLGGGGMSGSPIFPVVLNTVRRINEIGVIKPLIVGGGVMSQNDASMLISEKVSAIKLGVVSMLRPWRVRGIIKKIKATVSE